MASSDDAAMTKMVRSQLGRRYVDTSLLSVRVSHGVVHFSGVLRALRTHANMDLAKEMELISTVLRAKPGIRDIIWDVSQRV